MGVAGIQSRKSNPATEFSEQKTDPDSSDRCLQFVVNEVFLLKKPCGSHLLRSAPAVTPGFSCMIENIRKYKALIILSLVLVIVALVVGMKDGFFRHGADGVSMIRVDGRTYNDREFHQYGQGGLELAYGLVQSGGMGFDMDLFQFVTSLTAGASGRDEMPEKFFVSRMVLRRAAEDFGLYPSEDQISDYIRKMKSFSNKEGKFDEAVYRRFVEKGLGRLGLAESDVRELASDVLVMRKLNDLFSTGLEIPLDMARRMQALEGQKVSGALARLDLAPFKDSIKPTDEELKAYWENIQDAFKTEAKRNFTYVLVAPETVAAPEEKKPEPSLADAAMTDEAKKEAEKKKAEEKAKKDAEFAEAKRKKQQELDGKFNDFITLIEQNRGEKFEELAKQQGWEAKSSGLFAVSSPPADLALKLRASSRNGTAADDLFRLTPVAADPLSKISLPIAVGENQWLVARYDGEEASRTKTFDEAKEEVRSQYVAEKSVAAMKKAGNEAIEKIRAALATGKSFADAAKEAGINEVKTFEAITSTSTPDTATQPRELFQASRYADPGSLAELVVEPDRAFIVQVSNREFVKEANRDEQARMKVTSEASSHGFAAFRGWLDSRIEAAQVEALYRKP